MEHATGIMEHLTHLRTVAGQLGPGGVDVVDDQLQSLGRARRGRGEPGAEDDRAR
jgi:hypothetical protein